MEKDELLSTRACRHFIVVVLARGNKCLLKHSARRANAIQIQLKVAERDWMKPKAPELNRHRLFVAANQTRGGVCPESFIAQHTDIQSSVASGGAVC